MKITLTNIIQIEEPTQEILDYCKNELTFNNPDYTKKQRMGFWVGKTPKTIKLYDYYTLCSVIKSIVILYLSCVENILYNIFGFWRSAGKMPELAMEKDGFSGKTTCSS